MTDEMERRLFPAARARRVLLGAVALLGIHASLGARSRPEERVRDLEELYAEASPAESVPLRTPSLRSLILPDTRAEDAPLSVTQWRIRPARFPLSG